MSRVASVLVLMGVVGGCGGPDRVPETRAESLLVEASDRGTIVPQASVRKGISAAEAWSRIADLSRSPEDRGVQDRLFDGLVGADAAELRAASYRIIPSDVETYGYFDEYQIADTFEIGGLQISLQTELFKTIEGWIMAQRAVQQEEEIGVVLDRLDQLLAGVMVSAAMKYDKSDGVYLIAGLLRLHLMTRTSEIGGAAWKETAERRAIELKHKTRYEGPAWTDLP